MAQAENFLSGDSFAERANWRSFDRRLFEADARVNAAHCDALFNAGVLTRTETERIKNGLQAIVKRAGYDAGYFSETEAADVHEFAEKRLVQLVGEAAYKLNVGRSRADRAATVFRLWLREEIEKITARTRALQSALINVAEKYSAAILPFYAPLQTASPMLWAHWCLAHFERFARDRERLDEVWRRVNVMPLGSGNAAGINFEIDREEVARMLGFEGISLNSLDAVTDADYAVEFAGACVIAATHLARLADDLILFSSDELRFVEFDDESTADFSTQKTGALEIIKIKAARIFGNQTTLILAARNSTAFSGGGLGEIEQAIFDTADTLEISLRQAQTALENLRVKKSEIEKAKVKNHALASELADYLLHKNVPYREARETVEKILQSAAANKKPLDEIALDEMRRFSTNIEADVFDALDVEQALAAKSQIGGTAPERVDEALAAARASLEREE